MFKWFKKKLRPEPKLQLSALGAEIMEAMQNPDEWQADDYTIDHKKSGLDLWVANKDDKGTFFHVYRLPRVLIDSPERAIPKEETLKKMLTVEDKQVLAPVAYALQEKLNGTLTAATLNALRLARQTESINQ